MSLIKRIFILNTAVSLVPENWIKYPNINRYFEKYHRLPLLNGSDHQHLLKGTKRELRKDRPDILHFGLLTALGYCQIEKNIEVYFDLNGDLYSISSKTRLPRDQRRFYGLIESILSQKYTGSHISKVSKSVQEGKSATFSIKGQEKENLDLYSNFIFGGFSKGYLDNTNNLSDLVKLGDQSMELWTAISLVANKLFPNRK